MNENTLVPMATGDQEDLERFARKLGEIRCPDGTHVVEPPKEESLTLAERFTGRWVKCRLCGFDIRVLPNGTEIPPSKEEPEKKSAWVKWWVPAHRDQRTEE